MRSCKVGGEYKKMRLQAEVHSPHKRAFCRCTMTRQAIKDKMDCSKGPATIVCETKR